MEPGNPHITDDHRTGFGAVVNSFAALECLVDELILKLIGVDVVNVEQRSRASANAIILLTKLQTQSKTDFLRSLDAVENVEPGTWIGTGLTGILDRMKSKGILRNNVAHCIWDEGRSAGAVKPLVISASGRLKILGTHHNEKEWTANELKIAADEINDITRDLADWMKQHELRLRLQYIPDA
jgi:hypothetical protein